MKKTFSFKAKNKAPARQADAIKHEVKKYLARENRKKIPDGADYWAFDCKFGYTEDTAQVVKVGEIRPLISKAFDEGKEEFYLEILAKPGVKPKKAKAEDEKKEDPSDSLN